MSQLVNVHGQCSLVVNQSLLWERCWTIGVHVTAHTKQQKCTELNWTELKFVSSVGARFSWVAWTLLSERTSSFVHYSFNKLRVAYNDAFRQLLQEPRWCSASKLFVLNSVSSLPANMRKLTFSLWRSLQTSDNSLVNAVLSSDLFF